MPGWMPVTGLSWYTRWTGLQFWAPEPASKALPLRSSIVEEFKGTYQKENLERGGVVMPSKCLSHVEKKEAV